MPHLRHFSGAPAQCCRRPTLCSTPPLARRLHSTASRIATNVIKGHRRRQHGLSASTLERMSVLHVAQHSSRSLVRHAAACRTLATAAKHAITTSNAMQDAYIGIGSNIGNCALHIQQAMQQLRYNADTAHSLQVVRTSSMYQSQPMYKTDQPTFLNAVMHIRTSLSPTDLLTHLKRIEQLHGRHSGAAVARNSPRVLDLDIIFYGDQHVQLDNLQIPHPRIAEREFVLKPLCELAPTLQLSTLDGASRTVQQVLVGLYKQSGYQSQLQLCTPYVTDSKVDNGWSVFQWDARTYVMGICNVTPDSFSDGGKYESTSVMQHQSQFVDSIGQLVEDGLDVLDVGGQSTRPESTLLTAAQELERIAPVIELVRKHYPALPISVDTFYSQVAQHAIDTGCAIVNDVSGGQMDEQMYGTVASGGVMYGCMHMRGTPQTMTQEKHTTYNDLLQDVRTELQSSVEQAEAAGIHRWNLMADPGLGFAKTAQQSLQLVQNLADLRPATSIPLLVGASRKRFLANVLQQQQQSKADSREITMHDRSTATVALTTELVRQGTNMIRVHDVRQNAIAARLADALYRGTR